MAHDGCCVQFQCCKIITLHIQANNKHCFSLDFTLLLHAVHLDYLALHGEGEGSVFAIVGTCSCCPLGQLARQCTTYIGLHSVLKSTHVPVQCMELPSALNSLASELKCIRTVPSTHLPVQ